MPLHPSDPDYDANEPAEATPENQQGNAMTDLIATMLLALAKRHDDAGEDADNRGNATLASHHYRAAELAANLAGVLGEIDAATAPVVRHIPIAAWPVYEPLSVSGGVECL